ncbi:hypothetical protein BV22DRAFT_1032671 [Leucogyrophana mollusca]|uniref:Uncharacterized protein n=1 Tax=Leucogyrophana mollusca TaxID=85980 RepID=A0ACB8BMX9_9AGAM|nr:hypothetical protein BV22DRAFT_1032671 [Leucogyrophana mollusca]
MSLSSAFQNKECASHAVSSLKLHGLDLVYARLIHTVSMRRSTMPWTPPDTSVEKTLSVRVVRRRSKALGISEKAKSNERTLTSNELK